MPPLNRHEQIWTEVLDHDHWGCYYRRRYVECASIRIHQPIADLSFADRNLRPGRASCKPAAIGLANRADVKKPAVQASKDLTLKAIWSRSLKSARNLGADADVDIYSEDSGSGKSFNDLLKRADIQAVIIACVATMLKGRLTDSSQLANSQPARAHTQSAVSRQACAIGEANRGEPRRCSGAHAMVSPGS